MNLRAILLSFALVIVPSLSFAAEPVLNLNDVLLPAKLDGGAYAPEDVRKAILLGCQRRGWTAVDNGPNALRASITIRSKHYAEVDIPYNAAGYSIIYRDSSELDYNPKRNTIHGNYNKWIGNLSRTIQQQFGTQVL